MKTRISLLVAVLAGLALAPRAGAITMSIPDNTCQMPPFLNQSVSHKPQILVMQDNSGSMGDTAYATSWVNGKSYFGIWDSMKCYVYNLAGTYWVEDGPSNADYSCPDVSRGQWSGAALNYGTMRRMDVAKVVMVGGIVLDRTVASNAHVRGQTTGGSSFTQNIVGAPNFMPAGTDRAFQVLSNKNQFTTDVRSIEVDPGAFFTCARNEIATVCWGLNGDGQLGNNGVSTSPTPTGVSTTSPYPVTMSAGYDHTCGIASDGSLMCWGANTYGQLGIGTSGSTDMLVPTAVNMGSMVLPIRQVTAGYRYTCAIDNQFKLYCWGRNSAGQLGIGGARTTIQSSPKASFASAATVYTVTAGYDHTCAVTPGTTAGRETVTCWGNNNFGQLGYGSSISTTTPVTSVTNLTNIDLGTADQIQGAKGVQGIVANGFGHSCVANVKTGFAWCWGNNARGQLGNNTVVNSNVPVQVLTAAATNLSTVRLISAGGIMDGATLSAHTCATTTANAIYCWGANTYGQVGDNTVVDKKMATRVLNSAGSGNASAFYVAAGGLHTCAIDTGWGIDCWGNGRLGQVGFGALAGSTADNKKLQVNIYSGPSNPTSLTYDIEVETHLPGAKIQGVLHELVRSAKLGLMSFGYSLPTLSGVVLQPIGSFGAGISSLVASYEGVYPNGNTPLAMTVVSGVNYFRWDAPWVAGAYTQNTLAGGADADPWADPCTNSFMLFLSDGEPTGDGPFATASYATLADYDLNGRDYNRATTNQWGMGGATSSFQDYFDDAALMANSPRGILGSSFSPYKNLDTSKPDGTKTYPYGHRHGKGIPLYFIYTFGDPAYVRFGQRVGINGAFQDMPPLDRMPDYTSPYPEWDRNGDGLPDGFFYAQDGSEIQDAVRRAFSMILSRTAAGTSISMVSTNRRGEGSIVQSFFRPIFVSNAVEVNWIGMLQSLWIDQWGNVREDTDGDRALNPKIDRIVTYQYFGDPINETLANLWVDADGNGKRDHFMAAAGDVSGTSLYNVKPLFEAGAVLANKPYGDRRILTMHDTAGGHDQAADVGEVQQFSLANADYTFGDGKKMWSLLANPLHDNDGYGIAVTWSDAFKKVMAFVEGQDTRTMDPDSVPQRTRQVYNFNYRGSTFTSEWKMGDIMYSTPIIVSDPAERYDLLYRDKSYSAFYAQYMKRKPVMYTGANDGMFHAFAPGVYDPVLSSFSMPTMAGDSGLDFGEELGAFIPEKALPMLQYYANTGYNSRCHISFMDQPPRVTDARIFASDAVHPSGWGTILIAQMRLGCHDTAYTSMLVLDITDPDIAFSPSTPPEKVLLAELHPADMGFTFSMPAVVRVTDTTSTPRDTWFLVAGAGPETVTSVTRSKDAFLYVWNLGKLVQNKDASYIRIPNGVTGIESKSFTSDVISVDYNLDYKVDMLYFGTVADKIGAALPRMGGGVWRVVVNSDLDPTVTVADPKTWKISKVIDTDEVIGGVPQGRSVLAAPTVYLDPDDVKGGILTPYLSFQTGRYLSRTDPYDDLYYPCTGGAVTCTAQPYQAVYTMKDACLHVPPVACVTYTHSQLVNVTKFGVLPATGGGAKAPGSILSGYTVPAASQTNFNVFDTFMRLPTTVGWMIEEGNDSTPDNHERGSGSVVFHAPSKGLFFSTYTPTMTVTNASCTASGTGKVYALFFRTGTANPSSPLLYGQNARNPNLATIADNSSATTDSTQTWSTTSNTSGGAETIISGIAGLPATPTISKNKLIIQDNNAELMTMDRGVEATADHGFIFWRSIEK